MILVPIYRNVFYNISKTSIFWQIIAKCSCSLHCKWSQNKHYNIVHLDNPSRLLTLVATSTRSTSVASTSWTNPATYWQATTMMSRQTSDISDSHIHIRLHRAESDNDKWWAAETHRLLRYNTFDYWWLAAQHVITGDFSVGRNSWLLVSYHERTQRLIIGDISRSSTASDSWWQTDQHNSWLLVSTAKWNDRLRGDRRSNTTRDYC